MLQKKIVRILTFSDYIAHTEELFKKLNMMTVNNLYDYFVGIFVYKSINKKFPGLFCGIFSHNVTERNSVNLRPGLLTLRICEFSVKITGPKIWNALSRQTKSAKSMYSFKKLLKKELFAR